MNLSAKKILSTIESSFHNRPNFKHFSRGNTNPRSWNIVLFVTCNQLESTQNCMGQYQKKMGKCGGLEITVNIQNRETVLAIHARDLPLKPGIPIHEPGLDLCIHKESHGGWLQQAIISSTMTDDLLLLWIHPQLSTWS